MDVVEIKGSCKFWFFLLRGCQNGSLRCVKALLNSCREIDVDENSTIPLKPSHHWLIAVVDDILIQHSPSYGHDWSEVLEYLDEMIYSTNKEKQQFYREILMQSLFASKSDIALKYLNKIHPVASISLEIAMMCIFMKDGLGEFYYALCTKMRQQNFQMPSRTAAEMCIFCVLRKKNEKKMYLTLMHQNHCDFSFSDERIQYCMLVSRATSPTPLCGSF